MPQSDRPCSHYIQGLVSFALLRALLDRFLAEYFSVSVPSGLLIPRRTSVWRNSAVDLAFSLTTALANLPVTVRLLVTVFTVAPVLSDPPDREDVPGLTDTDLDMCLLINPTPLPRAPG